MARETEFVAFFYNRLDIVYRGGILTPILALSIILRTKHDNSGILVLATIPETYLNIPFLICQHLLLFVALRVYAEVESIS